jgi:hypothetical protein
MTALGNAFSSAESPIMGRFRSVEKIGDLQPLTPHIRTCRASNPFPIADSGLGKYAFGMTSPADDPRSVPELFDAALQADKDAAWDAVAALHWRGSNEVLDRALAFACSCDPAERGRAADILGQIGIPDRTFPDQCFLAVLRLLADDDQQVVFDAIFAL